MMKSNASDESSGLNVKKMSEDADEVVHGVDEAAADEDRTTLRLMAYGRAYDLDVTQLMQRRPIAPVIEAIIRVFREVRDTARQTSADGRTVLVRECPTCRGSGAGCPDCFEGRQVTADGIGDGPQTVTSVRADDNGHLTIGIKYSGFFLDKAYAGRVEVGDIVQLFGGGFGWRIQGVAVNGEYLWLMTDAEVHAEHAEWCRKIDAERLEAYERNKEKWLAQIAALPEPLRLRMERFMQERDFLKDSGSYELFCCTEAAKLFGYFQAEAEQDRYFHQRIRKLRLRRTQAVIDAFRALPNEEQTRLTGLDDGHSGNTFGCACALAARMVAGATV